MAKKKGLPVEPLAKASTAPQAIISKHSKEDEARERRWKAEDALRTMKEMKKIESDKGLMRDAKALAKEEMKKLDKICK